MVKHTWHHYHFFYYRVSHIEVDILNWILFWTLLDDLENKNMLFLRVNIIVVFDGHKYLASLFLLLFIILRVWFETVSVV